MAVWSTVDPTTVMWTHCVLDGMARRRGARGGCLRQELVARVFFDHYTPEHEAGSTPSPYGWFLDRDTPRLDTD